MPDRILRDWTDSEALSGVSAQAERLFVRLLMKMDDYGCYHGDPRLLRANLFPLLIDSVREADISRWIAECEKAGVVRSYVAVGRRYLHVPKHGQRLRDSKRKFPPPPAECSSDPPQHAATCGDSRPYSESESESESGAAHQAGPPPRRQSPGKPASAANGHPPGRANGTPGETPAAAWVTSRGVEIPHSLRTPGFRAAWAEWETHLREKGVRRTAVADRRQLAKCEAWGAARAVAALGHSAEGNYQGLFEPRGGGEAGGSGSGDWLADAAEQALEGTSEEDLDLLDDEHRRRGELDDDDDDADSKP